MSYKFNPFTGNFDEVNDIPKVTEQYNFFTVTQSGHSFDVLDPVYHDGTVWKAATLLNSGAEVATHIITKVDGDIIEISKYKKVTKSGHGLTIGDWYFTGGNGGISINDNGLISNPIFYVLDSSTILVDVMRPNMIGTGPTIPPQPIDGAQYEDATQVGHTFNIAEPVYFDGSWFSADSSDREKVAIGVIVEVDGDNFRVGIGGKFNIGTHGLTLNEWYVCANGGGLSTNEQMSGYHNPVFQVITTDEIRVIPYLPVKIER